MAISLVGAPTACGHQAVACAKSYADEVTVHGSDPTASCANLTEVTVSRIMQCTGYGDGAVAETDSRKRNRFVRRGSRWRSKRVSKAPLRRSGS